jgi:hypothetical protein
MESSSSTNWSKLLQRGEGGVVGIELVTFCLVREEIDMKSWKMLHLRKKLNARDCARGVLGIELVMLCLVREEIDMNS